MIPQDSFVIVAQIDLVQLDRLRSLLKSMTFADRAGIADPDNELVRFGNFDTIHFARFVVLADNTLSDRAAYPELPPSEPSYLCFMVDCDGPADELLARMTQSPDGLRAIFGHCQGFDKTADILEWLRARRIKPAASYVNWVGRSVSQVLDEARLHCQLRGALSGIYEGEPRRILDRLHKLIELPKTTKPAPPAPPARRIRSLSHLLLPFVLAAVFFVCFVLFPIITILLLGAGSVLFAVGLRRREQTDKIVEQRYDADWVAELRRREDHDVTNQYTAMGSIKPGRFRLWLEIAILYGINWVARHIFTRGSLARIGTIHFAHWVFLDQRRRGFFCSNYDGGHEAYMDDFINKAGFGLNLSFSSFIGYPTTNWLVARGAWLEQEFKRFQRRHQIPTDVWYRAYPRLTAHDLARNSRIRNGFEKEDMSDDEIRRWLAEI
jgi:hypothetical protein